MVFDYLMFLVMLTLYGESALVMYCEMHGCDPSDIQNMGQGDALPGAINGG